MRYGDQEGLPAESVHHDLVPATAETVPAFSGRRLQADPPAEHGIGGEEPLGCPTYLNLTPPSSAVPSPAGISSCSSPSSSHTFCLAISRACSWSIKMPLGASVILTCVRTVCISGTRPSSGLILIMQQWPPSTKMPFRLGLNATT